MYWSKGGCIFYVVCACKNNVQWNGGTMPMFLEEFSYFFLLLGVTKDY